MLLTSTISQLTSCLQRPNGICNRSTFTHFYHYTQKLGVLHLTYFLIHTLTDNFPLMDKTRQCNSYKTDFLDNPRNVPLNIDSIDNLAEFSMLENKTNLIDIISNPEQ